METFETNPQTARNGNAEEDQTAHQQPRAQDQEKSTSATRS